MPDKERIDVFISSTSEDLREHRRAVIDVLNTLKLQPNGMEDWSVTGETSVAMCERNVKDSDVFIGIYAHRYGWCPDGYGGKSITELEYDWATEQRLPQFCFIVDDDYEWPPRKMELDALEKLNAFKAKVKSRAFVGFFTTPENLQAKVIASLSEWKAKHGVSEGSDANATGGTARKTTITDRNREILLKKVREFWIEGYLNKSMIDDVWLDLPVEQRPDAVEPSIARELNDGAMAPLLLTPDASIGALFRATERALLILGAPGSGKTITLLELAKDLLDEAERDSRKPMPVVLNLASWAEKQPERLEDWLIERLDHDYGVSRKVGERWIADGELLFLLDGLDEVAEAHRKVCVTAINVFWQRTQALGENGIAVCSRISEYETLSSRLNVQKAVQLQPLTLDQANTYLGNLGNAWNGLQQAVQKDGTLQAMAASPLLLNIMAVAYRDKPEHQLIDFATQTAQKKHLFDHYVSKRLSGGSTRSKYERQKARHYLAWLAKGLRTQNQSVFHIEDLRLVWLNHNQRRRSKRLSLLFGILSTLVGGLVGIAFDKSFGLLSGLIFGVSIGLAVGTIELNKPRFADSLAFSWRKFGTAFFGGLICGLFVEPVNGPFVGMFVGLSVGVIFSLNTKAVELKSLPNQSVWRSVRSGLIGGLLLGVASGLIVGLVFGLYIGVFVGALVGLIVALLLSVVSSLFGALALSLISSFQFGLAAVIAHVIIRRVLWHTGDAPLNYAEFLKYTTSRHLTRQIGGGFIFRHRLLMEHFAESDW